MTKRNTVAKVCICFRTGGLSEDNISLEIKWDQNTDPLCAFVLKIDQMWYSGQCSDRKMFYCSLSDGIQYFKTHSSWDEASMSCQKKSGQLVNMWNITAYNWKTSWIGAYERNDVWSWVGNSTHSFTNWAPNEPQSRNCALYNLSSQKYRKTFCSKKRVPLCLSDNLLVVKENKTWEEAQIYCLNMKACWRGTVCKETYNLLSLDETSDYNYIRDRIYRATTTEVCLLLVGCQCLLTYVTKMHTNTEERETNRSKHTFLSHSEYGLTLCFTGVDWPALPGRVMVLGRRAQPGTDVGAAPLPISEEPLWDPVEIWHK